MKILSLFALVLSTAAQANSVDTVFSSSSELPYELRELVLSEVTKGCGAALVQGGLKEVSTTVEERQIDQGQVDLYFVTTFTGAYTSEGRSLAASIEVVSAKYSFTNPAFSPLAVKQVSANAPGLCR